MTHDEIMTALKVELNDKRMNGKTNFQKGLFRWIEDKSFEHYRGKKLETVDMGYGTELA
jgi:actin-related protein